MYYGSLDIGQSPKSVTTGILPEARPMVSQTWLIGIKTQYWSLLKGAANPGTFNNPITVANEY